MHAATLLLLSLVQEDLTEWVERLGRESIVEREEATEHLTRLGPAALERLEKAREGAQDPETRTRLEYVITTIRKRAEFARVFGPTKRVTIRAKGRRLGEVLEELGKKLDERIEGEKIDLDRPVDLDLADATMWQALDALAAAAKVRYDSQDDRIVLREGSAPSFPIQYFEQFRVSMVETKRIEHRAPGLSAAVGVAVVEVRYQKNLKPASSWFCKNVTIASVTDAKGNDAGAPDPNWGGGTTWSSRPFAVQNRIYMRSDASGPLTLVGTTDLPFASDITEISLPLSGEKREKIEGPFVLSVAGFTQSSAGTHVTLRANSRSNEDVVNRLLEAEIAIVDAEQKRHVGRSGGGGGSTGSWSWDFEFDEAIPNPEKVVFRWVREFHRVQIPFRLEGVTLP